MAKKQKQEIIEDVGEYLDEVMEGQEEADTITIPVNVVEALLVGIATGDRNAINNVGAEIRQMAEDQAPGKFPTHR